MNSKQLADRLGILVREERKMTHEILELIQICLAKRTYLELGFSSMFDWLVKGFGYSNAAAQRRIETARLLKTVPEAKEKLRSGLVNLSTLSKAQSVIRQQEKLSGVKVSPTEQEKAVYLIENKSALEAEQILVSLFPATASSVHQERKTVINENQIRHQMNLTKDASQNIQRAKEILSHKFPNASDAEVITYALDFLLAKIDPLRKIDIKRRVPQKSGVAGGVPTSVEVSNFATKDLPARVTTSAAEVNPHPNLGCESKLSSKATLRREAVLRDGGKCSFRDPRTGRLCGSAYQIQLDHIVPRALGGSDHPSNLRVLCRQHNLLMAERIFGKKIIDNYRAKR